MTTPVEAHGRGDQVLDSVLRIELNRPKQKNALDVRRGRRSWSMPSRRHRRTTRCGPSASPAGVADFCSGADWVASNSDHSRAPPDGQPAATHPVAGAPAHRTADQHPAAGGVRGPRMGGGARVPDRPGLRLHRRRRVESVLGALPVPWLLSGQRSDLAGTPPDRRRPGPGVPDARTRAVR